MDGDVASLVAEMMPFMSAAMGAYGAAVLTRARDDAADVTVDVGRRLLQKVFSSRHEGEPLPGRLSASAGTKGDGEALETVRLAACRALAADPALVAEVRSILVSAPHTAQQASAGRDANIVSSYSTTINYHYGSYPDSPAGPDRHTAGEPIGSQPPKPGAGARAARNRQSPDAEVIPVAPACPQGTTEAPRPQPGTTRARLPAVTTMASALRNPCLRQRALVISAILALSATFIVLMSQPGHSPGRSGERNAAPSPVRADPLTDPGNFHYVSSAAFSPGGKILAAGDVNGATYLWNLGNSEMIASLTDPGRKGVYSVAFSPGGKILAVGDDDGQIYLWNPATDVITARLNAKGGSVYSVAFGPDGKALAAGYRNGIACLWNVATHSVTARLPEPPGSYVTSVAFSPDGKDVAVGDNNGTTYLWNPAARQSIPFTADTSTDARSVAFSPDGATLAVGDSNGTTYLWNLDTHRDVLLTDPKSKGVRSVAFGPGGATLAVGDGNGITYLWNLDTHRDALLTGTQGAHVDSVAFSPDGATLAVGDGNGTTYLWNLPPT
jgi:WD domain, G-beta repeat